MPASFQVVAAPFDDATLLDLGEMFQSRTRYHRAHPAIA
jgi:Asp-tRNA(Asn)/Glu-tRNA(Gln) amidotransferase A subunit family amidase